MRVTGWRGEKDGLPARSAEPTRRVTRPLDMLLSDEVVFFERVLARRTMAGEGDVVLSHLLSEVESRVTRRLSAVLSTHGCTLEQWRVLSLLVDGAGRPMSEIASSVMLPAPTLTKLIDRMVADNLVYRRGDEQDRRRVLVFPSDRGLAKYLAIKSSVDSEQTELVQLLGNKDVATLTKVLSRAADALR